jgi:hypothetical protein
VRTEFKTRNAGWTYQELMAAARMNRRPSAPEHPGPCSLVPGLQGIRSWLEHVNRTRSNDMNGVRDLGRFRRIATGVAMIATAPVVLASVAIKPADDGVKASDVLANLSSNASAMEASLALGLVAIALLIPATLGLLRIAQQRSPVLALVGASLTLLGWVAFMGQQVLGEATLVMAASPDRAAMATLYDQIGNSNLLTVVQLGFIVGHVLGVAILGIAVARSQVAPTWIGIVLVVSGPLHFVAHLINLRPLDLGAFALLVLGYGAAGVILIRMQGETSTQASTQTQAVAPVPTS